MSGVASAFRVMRLIGAALLLVALPGIARAENVVFPPDAAVVDVTKPPYGARGDGRTDDTAALQRALDEQTGRGTILYLPNGVYLVSASLRLPLKNPKGQTNWGNTHIQGQSRAGTILRLKDGAFADRDHPAAVLDSGPHGSADWFHNDIRNLTIDTGRGNPGAIGARYFSNNTGCVRDVTIRSSDGQGRIGLDLAYNDMNGPLLVSDVEVWGFDVGVACGHTVNSQTFSHLRLEDQRTAGLVNDGQYLAVEDLRSRSAAPALVNRSGLIALVGARLEGVGSQGAAIENRADLYARNVRAPGYARAIAPQPGSAPAPEGVAVSEYVSAPVVRLFGGPATALRLPIRQTPPLPSDATATWASPTQHGARPDERADASAAIQSAIDSGATTVYLPSGTWRIGQTIHVRGRVRRILGIECHIEPIAPLLGEAAPIFRVESGAGPVCIERISTNFVSGTFWFVEHASDRTLILRDLAVNFQSPDAFRGAGGGDVFIENMVGGPFHFHGQRVWARQLNQESQGLHIENDAGRLWILGLKTERGGTLVDTHDGGRTEVLGGLCYTTTAGKLAPMFTNEDSTVSVTLGERCYTGDPYTVIVRETRGGLKKSLPRADPAYGGRLVLYSGMGGWTRPRRRETGHVRPASPWMTGQGFRTAMSWRTGSATTRRTPVDSCRWAWLR